MCEQSQNQQQMVGSHVFKMDPIWRQIPYSMSCTVIFHLRPKTLTSRSVDVSVYGVFFFFLARSSREWEAEKLPRLWKLWYFFFLMIFMIL